MFTSRQSHFPLISVITHFEGPSILIPCNEEILPSSKYRAINWYEAIPRSCLTLSLYLPVFLKMSGFILEIFQSVFSNHSINSILCNSPRLWRKKKPLCKNTSLVFNLYQSTDFSVNWAFKSDIRCSYTWSFSQKLPQILFACVGSYQR